MEKEKLLRAPYATSGVADEMLDLFKRVNPQKIDTKFVVDNGISTSNNAFAAVDFLRWLKIVDQEGKVSGEKANQLKLVGEERENFIRNQILESYSDLFEEIRLENAKRDDLVNYFIRKQKLGTGAAKAATALFLHLCYKYNIPVADELKKKTHTGDGKPRKPKEKKIKKFAPEMIEELSPVKKISVIIRSPLGNNVIEAIDKSELKNLKEKVEKILNFVGEELEDAPTDE